jgi:hypothetical protein
VTNKSERTQQQKLTGLNMTTFVLNILLAALAVSMFVSNSDGFVLNGHQVKMTDSDSSKDTVIEDLNTHQP